MLYVGLVIVWVFLLPGYVANRDKALTNDDVATHLACIDGTASGEWDDYKASERAAKAATRVISQERPDKAESAKSQLAALTASQEKIAPPFRVIGLASDWLTGIWAVSYLGFAILIVLWRSVPRYAIRPVPTLLAAVGLYLIFNWSVLIRTFRLNTLKEGRNVYYYAHLDVSPTGFILQECRAYVFMVFIAFFIGLADSVAGQFRDSVGSALLSTISLSDLKTAAVKNIEMLRLWQFSSLLLAVIFIPWSYFYWDNIVSVHDRRYLPAAIGIHLIWLFCWYQATRPLLLSLQNWRELKLSALSAPGADRAAILDISEAAHTESEWQLISAGVAALGSLIVPLMKALK